MPVCIRKVLELRKLSFLHTLVHCIVVDNYVGPSIITRLQDFFLFNKTVLDQSFVLRKTQQVKNCFVCVLVDLRWSFNSNSQGAFLVVWVSVGDVRI